MSNVQVNSVDASEYQLLVTATRITVATTAFYIYDWLVTLDLEIDSIWFSQWTLSTWILTASRYATWIDMITQVVPTPNKTSCGLVVRLGNLCAFVQILATAIFTGLRTYALCGRRWWVLFVVLALSAIPAFVNLAVEMKGSIQFMALASPTNICGLALPFTGAQQLQFSLIARISSTIAEIMALAATWRESASLIHEASYRKENLSLGGVLLRDGSVLFLTQLLLNIYQLLVYTVPSFEVLGNGNAFMTPLETILLCRFMINLRQASQRSNFEFSNLTTVLGSAVYMGSDTTYDIRRPRGKEGSSGFGEDYA